MLLVERSSIAASQNNESLSKNDDSLSSNESSSGDMRLNPDELYKLKSGQCGKFLPEYEPKANYYKKYWELYFENEKLMEEVNLESKERNEVLKEIIGIETFYDGNIEKLSSERYLHNGRKRHNRRCADELDKQFKCPYEGCSKLYGSEGSLNLHIKLKHNGGNKTDREKIAKSLVYANAKGINLAVE